MTYCEQHLKRIYQNYLFSTKVYCRDKHYLSCLFYQVLVEMDKQMAYLKSQRIPHGEIMLYGNRYRRLIMTHYFSQATA